MTAEELDNLEALLNEYREALHRACDVGDSEAAFAETMLLHAPSLIESARREARLETAARAFCDSFAEHADRCRPCAIAWQNLKAALATQKEGKS